MAHNNKLEFGFFEDAPEDIVFLIENPIFDQHYENVQNSEKSDDKQCPCRVPVQQQERSVSTTLPQKTPSIVSESGETWYNSSHQTHSSVGSGRDQERLFLQSNASTQLSTDTISAFTANQQANHISPTCVVPATLGENTSPKFQEQVQSQQLRNLANPVFVTDDEKMGTENTTGFPKCTQMPASTYKAQMKDQHEADLIRKELKPTLHDEQGQRLMDKKANKLKQEPVQAPKDANSSSCSPFLPPTARYEDLINPAYTASKTDPSETTTGRCCQQLNLDEKIQLREGIDQTFKRDPRKSDSIIQYLKQLLEFMNLILRLLKHKHASHPNCKTVKLFSRIKLKLLDRKTVKVRVRKHLFKLKHLQYEKQLYQYFEEKGALTLKSFIKELHFIHKTVIEVYGLKSYFDRLSRGESLSENERMHYEWLRLISFNHYSGNGNTISLAGNGFYHDSAAGPSTTRCYLCGTVRSDWTYFQNVEAEHRRISPNCPFYANRRDESVNISASFQTSSQPQNGQNASTTRNNTQRNVSNRVQFLRNSRRPEEATYSAMSSRISTVSSNVHANGTMLNSLSVTENVCFLPTPQIEQRFTGEDGNVTLPDPGLPFQASSAAQVNLQNESASSARMSSATALPMRNKNQSELHVLRGANGSASCQDTGEPDVTTQQEDKSASKSSRSAPPRVSESGGRGRTVTVVVDNAKHPEYRELDARINSYQGCPDYLDQTARQMAEAGFFFVGKADCPRCFCCGGGLRNWKPVFKKVKYAYQRWPHPAGTASPHSQTVERKREHGVDPTLEHARWFPQCEYIHKLKGERYVTEVQRYHQQQMEEQQRQQQELTRSRANRSPPNPMITETAAVLCEMGYQQDKIRDAILTVRRRNGVSDVTTQQVLAWLLDQHESRSPPTSSGSSPTRGRGGRTDPTITVVVDNAKHPDYRELDARINSYQGWPDYLDQTARQMAEAGFFFVGKADYTRCFCCGGGLRNWDPGDDPMLEHARWFPRCEYVKKLKGERYVVAVQRRHQQHMEEQQRQQQELARSRDATGAGSQQSGTNTSCSSVVDQQRKENDSGQKNDELFKSAEATGTCSQQSYTNASTMSSGSLKAEKPIKADDSKKRIIKEKQFAAFGRNSAEELKPAEGINKQTKENEKSRETQGCKICMQRPITTTFLPCGHSACCEQCAVKQTRCPVCRKRINGLVQEFNL